MAALFPGARLRGPRLLEGLAQHDLYPGYGRIARRFRTAEQDDLAGRQERLAEAGRIRDEAKKSLDETIERALEARGFGPDAARPETILRLVDRSREPAPRLEAREEERRGLEARLGQLQARLERAQRERAAEVGAAAALAAELASLKAQGRDPSREREARPEAQVARLEQELGAAREARDAALPRAEAVGRTAVERFERMLAEGREQEARIARLEPERAELTARLATRDRAIGRELARRMIAGGVYPSCWEQDGRPVFVFEILLRPGGRVVVWDTRPEAFRARVP